MRNHQFFYTFIKKSLLFRMCLILATGTSIYSCIPIEDEFFPVIEEFAVEKQLHFYGDTLKVSFAASDNFFLDSGSIKIRKAIPVPTDQNRWELDSLVDLAGRKFSRNLAFRIPLYVDTGLYLIEASTTDAQKNETTDSLYFEIGSDPQKPVFAGVDIENLTLSNEQWSACRSESILLKGLVTDNVKLTKFGYAWSGQLPQLTRISTDTLMLEDFFNDNLKVPSSIANATEATLNLIAVDSFENISIYPIPFYINCDDQPPVVELGASFPRISSNLTTAILQGQSLRFQNIKVYDNDFLAGVKIYAGVEDSSLVEIAYKEFNTSDTVNLNEHFDLSYPIPFDTPVGQIRYLVIKAADSVFGFDSAPETRITLYVVEDEGPNLIITDQYINGENKVFSYENPLPVNVGDVISFEGKVEEQLALRDLHFYWYDESIADPQPLYQYAGLTSFPLNLNDYYASQSFKVPDTVSNGDVFVLTIYVNDLKGQTKEKSYRFVVNE